MSFRERDRRKGIIGKRIKNIKKIRYEKYIEKLIDRIDYKDEQTKKRMEYLKITAIEDINKKINKEEQK